MEPEEGNGLGRYKSRLLALLIVGLLFGAPIVAVRWMTSVPGESYAGKLPPLTKSQIELADRMRGHVVSVASVPHNVAHVTELGGVATYIETQLSQMGYPVRSQNFHAGGQRVRNLEVIVEPAQKDAPTLVVGAHYDSFSDAPGANDNGSGVAALIELARDFRDLRGKSNLRLRLVWFTNEEPPFFQESGMGSLVYAKWLRKSGERVSGMYSLETMGFYSDAPGSQHYPFPLNLLYPNTGNFIAFVSTTASRDLVRDTIGTFRRQARFPSVGGTAPGAIQGIDWSDHWAFERQGFPALMVTDTAPFRYRFYHTTADTPDKLDYERLARVVDGLEHVIRDKTG